MSDEFEKAQKRYPNLRRPPLGMKPRWLWLEERALELMEAIKQDDEPYNRRVDFFLELLSVLKDWEKASDH